MKQLDEMLFKCIYDYYDNENNKITCGICELNNKFLCFIQINNSEEMLLDLNNYITPFLDQYFYALEREYEIEQIFYLNNKFYLNVCDIYKISYITVEYDIKTNTPNIVETKKIFNYIIPQEFKKQYKDKNFYINIHGYVFSNAQIGAFSDFEWEHIIKDRTLFEIKLCTPVYNTEYYILKILDLNTNKNIFLLYKDNEFYEFKFADDYVYITLDILTQRVSGILANNLNKIQNNIQFELFKTDVYFDSNFNRIV